MGATWSTPADRTAALLPPGYTWDAVGPGIGIVTQFNHPGRIIIPAKGRNIYSDDHGATWNYALAPAGSDEGTIVELMDGRLMRNDRPVSSQWELSKRRRVSAGSIESGFPAFTSDNTLLDPKCEASILRYNTDAPHRIVFLNSASTVTRGKMRVRISYDDGQTWPISRRIYDWLTEDEAQQQGKGGYSSMIKTSDYHVAALIEVNEDTGNNSTSHRSIEFHKFNLPWMLNGNPEP
jgi:sialidase-1